MAETPAQPWLTIVGMGEGGRDSLAHAARNALDNAELIMGSTRHLALVGEHNCPVIEWPVPYADGVPLLMAERGRRVVALASGDPFWFGAGAVLARHIPVGEWVAYPSPSSFSLAASRLGWPLQHIVCLGLHAAPLSRLRPHLAHGQRIIALLRDGEAAGMMASYVAERGFGASTLTVLEALGGPHERARQTLASDFALTDIRHPVAVAIDCAGGPALPVAAGRLDHWFDHDGQISKRPIRALTLSALAPRPGEMLWDIGAGSGSISIEWLLAHPANRARAFEADPVRAARAKANAVALGVDHLEVIAGHAPDMLDGRAPDAVFIGGGLSAALLDALWLRLPAGTRLVANAVTLESEALLTARQVLKGGELMRIELSDTAPIGTRRVWRARYPVVQWSVVL